MVVDSGTCVSVETCNSPVVALVVVFGVTWDGDEDVAVAVELVDKNLEDTKLRLTITLFNLLVVDLKMDLYMIRNNLIKINLSISKITEMKNY